MLTERDTNSGASHMAIKSRRYGSEIRPIPARTNAAPPCSSSGPMLLRRTKRLRREKPTSPRITRSNTVIRAVDCQTTKCLSDAEAHSRGGFCSQYRPESRARDPPGSEVRRSPDPLCRASSRSSLRGAREARIEPLWVLGSWTDGLGGFDRIGSSRHPGVTTAFWCRLGHAVIHDFRLDLVPNSRSDPLPSRPIPAPRTLSPSCPARRPHRPGDSSRRSRDLATG